MGVESTPTDIVFFICFAGFLAGCLLVLASGGFMYRAVRDNESPETKQLFTTNSLMRLVGLALIAWYYAKLWHLKLVSGVWLLLFFVGRAGVIASLIVFEIR